MNPTLDELIESILRLAYRMENNFFQSSLDETVHEKRQEPEETIEPQLEKPKPAHVASRNTKQHQEAAAADQIKKTSKIKCEEKKTKSLNDPAKKGRGKKRGSNKNKSHRKTKVYTGVVRSWIVKHVTTIVRFHPPTPQHIDLQGSQKSCVCVGCQTSFRPDGELQQHVIRCHGGRFDLSPLLEIDKRNHTIERAVLEVKLEQLPRADVRFWLQIKNLAKVTLLLKSVYVFDGKKSLIPIFDGDAVLRMASEYWYEDEIQLDGLNLVAGWMYTLLVTVNPIDGERLPYDIVVQHHFRQSNKKNLQTVGVPLKLAQLPNLRIPEAIKILYQNNFKKRAPYGPEELKMLRQVEEAKKPSSLTKDNYAKQLKVLNRIEAEHLRCEFEGYTIERPQLKTLKKVKKHKDGTKYKQILYVLSIDQFQNRPTLIQEDTFVNITVLENQTVEYYKGAVEYVEHTMILLLLEKPILTPANAQRIEFHFNKVTFQLEQQALRLLSECRKEDIIFPTRGERKPLEEITSFQWIRKNITSNEEQMMAVRNIVNRTSFPAPYILFGPPGTGKSSTLVEAIGQICQLHTFANILLVAPSNFAANEIVSRLLVHLPQKSIYRFFSQKCFRKVDEIDGDILEISNMIDKEYDLPCYEDIYLARVVVATLATAGRLVQANIAEKHFNYIIIDECGSAKEISALVPIGGLATCGDEIHASIVLAGDPKQLGPVIRYDLLKQTTHSISLLERIMKLDMYSMNPTTKEYDTSVITQLRDSFRSHTKLLQFSNNMFYDGQLRAKALPEVTDWAIGWHRLPNPKCPLIFRSVIGQIKQDNSGFSLYNLEECEVVLYYVRDILTNGINGRTVKQSEIGIISPYSRQVLHLRVLCKAHHWAGIEIGSAEQYQGREKEIIIISTVRSRSNHVGFLSDVKRLNVTITRAKALMIVVGDATTLQRNQHWQKFIAYCRNNKAYIDARPPMIPAAGPNKPTKAKNKPENSKKKQSKNYENFNLRRVKLTGLAKNSAATNAVGKKAKLSP